MESIDYLKKKPKISGCSTIIVAGANVHQYYMMIFNHTDRHLRQIRKVKADANYPK